MKKRFGFTLVEVLVVMVVIGILIALIIPNALQAINIANIRDCANNIRTLDSSIQLYFAQNRSWPSDLNLLCSGGFLPSEACTGTGTGATFDNSSTGMQCRAKASNPAYSLDNSLSFIDRTNHFTATGSRWPDVHD